MTEEEKKAIEIFDGFIKTDKDEISEIEQLESDYYDEELDLLKRRVKWFTILLNLIQKQDTEINKLNKEIKQLKEDISNMYDEKVVRNILQDECGLLTTEIDEILN